MKACAKVSHCHDIVIVVIGMILILLFMTCMQEGATPLFVASQNGHKEVAQLLLLNGAQPDIPDKVSTTNFSTFCL